MANPLISNDIFKKDSIGQLWQDEVMTLDGTINKSIVLVTLTILSAIWVWNYSQQFFPYMIPIIIITALIALVIIFFKKSAVYLAVLYAILEWILIWVLSSYYEMQFPGIVVQAVSLTFWVFAVMLALYKTGVVRATENLKLEC